MSRIALLSFQSSSMASLVRMLPSSDGLSISITA